MTRLAWNVVGSRFYEAGLDRGVLYVDELPGVPWIGLTEVAERSSGGESRPYYLDGVKYLNEVSAEEFEATISAYTYPDEFAQCDGSASARPGLIVTMQRRKKFGLSYRTKVGNDLDGVDYAYKIHLVYNAVAYPSDRGYATLQDTAEPIDFSWDISTQPTTTPGYKPTAHIVIDSRTTAGIVLEAVENILYGTDTTPPRLPSFSELVSIFDVPTLTVVDNGDGTYTVTGPDSAITMLSSDTFQITWPTVEFIDADSYTISSS